MEVQQPPSTQGPSRLRLTLRILKKVIVWLILLIIAIFLLILTPPVQNFITGKATRYLENKLGTKVEIDRLFITLNGRIAVDGIYLEDQQGDTLLYAGNLRVSLNLYKAIFKGSVDISSVDLDGITARVIRPPADSAFNYQYIIDAFAGDSDDTDTGSSSGGSSGFKLGHIKISNANLRYADALSGEDYRAVWKDFATNLSEMDPDNQNYIIGNTLLRGLTASIERRNPIAPKVVQVVTDSVVANDTITGEPILVKLSQLRLEDVDFVYDDSVSLTRMYVNTSSLVLDAVEAAPGETRYQAGLLNIAKTKFSLDNNNEPAQTQGIDFAHLNTDINDLRMKGFIMRGDSLRGSLQSVALKEKSGLDIRQLSGDFFYGPQDAYITGLDLRTGNSQISRDLHIQYDSIGQISTDIASVYADIDLRKTRIRNSDILFFAPDLRKQPLFANAADYWTIDAQLKGNLNELIIDEFQLAGPDNLRATLAGRLQGVMDPEKLNADLSIEEIYVTRSAIVSFVPPGQLPENIGIPDWIKTTGSVHGNARQARMALRVLTDQGRLDLDGYLTNAADPERMEYAMQLNAQSLDLAYLLKDTMYGEITARFEAKGRGTDIKTMDAELKGQMESMRLNGYTYRDMPITASVRNQQAELQTGLDDPNLHFSLVGKMDLSKEYPSLSLNAMIDSARLQETNWTSDPWIVRTGIQAEFENVDPDNLDGQLFLNQLLVVKEDERLQLDTVKLLAGTNDTARYLRLESDIASVNMEGRYKLTQLGDVITQLVNPYYDIGSVSKAPDAYDFQLNASLTDRPMLRSLVPGLEMARGVSLESRFSNDSGMHVDLKADQLNYDGNQVNGLLLSAQTTDSALVADARLASLQSGGLHLDSTIVTAKLADNTIDWDALLKDAQAKDQYHLAGQVRQSGDDMLINLKPGELMLNYEKWQLSDSNQLRIGSGGIWARNFELRNGSELLSLNSRGASANAPLHVSLKDFQASNITAMVLSDSTMINGSLTGEIDLTDLTGNPKFTGDLNMQDLSYKQDTVGNLSAKFSNAGGGNLIRASVELTGRGNDVSIDGNYDAANAALDLTMDLKKLPMQTVEAFSGGAVRNTSGYLDGPFKVTGPVASPVVKGELRFHDTRMNVATLNSYFGIDNEKLEFTGEGLRLNQFQVKDSSGNEMIIDGAIKTRNYTNYKFDLDMRARNFQALNSTKRDNKLFWGRLFFNTNLKVTGTEARPIVDGRLTINDKTQMTVVLPQSEPGVVEREGVIVFVDMDAPINDSLFLAAYDSLNVAGIRGMDVSVNISIDKGADFTLIIDEGNGDFLNVRGEAQLNTGIDPSGKITMVGTYELEQGTYELSFNMLRKKFDIQKGSKITWEGEPTTATVDITAKYVANTAPLDLVKGQLDENTPTNERNMYLQRLPFDVNLRMQGQLMHPQITFDIVLPDNKNYGVATDIITNVRTRLEQLRQSPGDMNKQVFSLLLLNRFVADNPFSSVGNTSASTVVRQSVSKLLTEQLNRLAEGLIQGVDINLGIEASDDYTTGTRQDRTDLNVGLSKRLMNDRLTVTVGSNFNLEGPQDNTAQANNIAGNVAVDYALSSDGRYKLRAYRKNDYQGVIDGFVVETGVSFIITLDYNEFKQIFRKRRRPGDQQGERRERTTEGSRQNDNKDNNNSNKQATPASGTKKEDE